MKREIILSFRPEYFKPLLYGQKKYEYRKRFTKDPVRAYLYLSLPVQHIIGIIEFGSALSLEEQQITFGKDSKACLRITEMMSDGTRFAIPVISLQLFETPLALKEIQGIQKGFKPPMSYANLKNYDLLEAYLHSRTLLKTTYTHLHHKIYSDNIGCSCAEMALEESFKMVEKVFKEEKIYKPLMTLLEN